MFWAILILVIMILIYATKDKNKSSDGHDDLKYAIIVESFQAVLDSDDVVILDVETTGLGKKDQIVEIVTINMKGEVLLNERVLPTCPIPRAASEIHGLTKRNLRNCPSWNDIDQKVREVLKDKIILAYNSEFDVRLLNQTAYAHHKSGFLNPHKCVMIGYAYHRAEPDKYGRGFKWHKLTDAIRYEGIQVKGAHSAEGDCLMTLELMRTLAKR